MHIFFEYLRNDKRSHRKDVNIISPVLKYQVWSREYADRRILSMEME